MSAPVPPEEIPPYRDHLGGTRQYLRDVILGVNDGLVSMFLLVAGVVGGTLTTAQVLLTGIAGALAGAVSMAAGEYLATKSQDEAFQAELETEAEHLRYYRDQEIGELREMFAGMGLHGADLDAVVEILQHNDEAMMQLMAGLEFGIVEQQRRNPYRAALLSGVLFILGSLPPVLPFVFVVAPSTGLVWAGLATGIALFVVGIGKTAMTRKNPILSGLENLAIGFGGATLSFLVGRLFGQSVLG